MKISIPPEWTAYLPKFLQNPDCAWMQEHQDKISQQELAERAPSIIEDWRNTTRANSALRLQRAMDELDYDPDQNWAQATTNYLQAVAGCMQDMAKVPQRHFDEDEDGEPLPADESLRRAVSYILGSMREAYDDWMHLTRGRNLAAAC